MDHYVPGPPDKPAHRFAERLRGQYSLLSLHSWQELAKGQPVTAGASSGWPEKAPSVLTGKATQNNPHVLGFSSSDCKYISQEAPQPMEIWVRSLKGREQVLLGS